MSEEKIPFNCYDCNGQYSNLNLKTEAGKKERCSNYVLFSLSEGENLWVYSRLQALVYDILPSTTALFSYAIGSRKRAVFLLVLKQW